MIDIRQSRQYACYLQSLGWVVEKKAGTHYFIKKIPILGSILKIQRPNKIDIASINQIVKKYRVFQTVIEPASANHQSLIINHQYKLSKSPYLPTKTLHLDLAKPIKLPKEVRRCIRIGEKSAIKAHSSPAEIKIWREAWKKSVGFGRFIPSTTQLINLRQSFPKNYSLFLASHNNLGKIISGAIFTRTLHTAYYWYAFNSREGRASLAQYALLYRGILWAKEQGCRIFDFEGIFDPRFPNQSWLGFSHFKRSFGGYEVEYPGCYTKLNLGNIFPRFR